MFRSLLPALMILLTPVALTGEEQSQDVRRVSLNRDVAARQSGGFVSSSLLVLPARLNVERVSLPDALEALRTQSGVPIGFSPSRTADVGMVTCRCGDLSVSAALSILLAGTGFQFAEFGDRILIDRQVAGGRAASPQDIAAAQIWGQRGQIAVDRGAVRVQPSQIRDPFVDAAGTITGRVVDRRTNQPLATVQVHIPSVQVGALTDGAGRFVLSNVPVGVHELRAERIGYQAFTASVDVSDGATLTLNISMQEQALSLDAVVVTGTAGQARRREVGNTLVQVDVSSITDPTPSVDQILQAAGPGISVIQSSASLGGGARIRLRGSNSVAMGNQPMLFIDGVRMHNNSPPPNTPIDGSGARSSHVHISPMNDLNPDDIERIEIIKGAAATTLYGTEASAGVIQIFTKRGNIGAPVWTLQMDYGLDTARKFAPEPEPYMRLDCCFQTGVRQRVSGSVGGGSQNVRYFVSAGVQDNTGILPLDTQSQVNIRGNFAIQVSEKLNLDYNTGWSRNSFRHTPQGNNSQGLVTIAYRDVRGGLGVNWRDRIEETYAWEITNDHSHVVTGLTAIHSMSENVSNKLTLGIDQLNVEMRSIRPFGFVFEPRGVVNNGQYTHRSFTVDWQTNVTVQPTRDVRATLSAGAQLLRDEEVMVNAYSDNLPGPGVPTVSSGARQLSSEDRQRTITGGLFTQALVGYLDRYFLTLGLRVDGNSAFGSDFGLQPYPKASLSYVISDESFWPEGLGDMKLRAAYGHAGRAPGAFDASRTWAPVGFGGQPAFYPNQVGNPELGPERTAEMEMGFDLNVLDGRVSLEVTHFDQVVSDALFPVAQIPSLGFGSSQLTNVGKVGNRGFEVGLNAAVVDAQWGGWDLGLSFTQQKNKILDLGDSPESNSIRLGQPFPVMVGTKLFNPDEVAPPNFVTDHVFGPREPTHIVGVNSSLRLPLGVRASFRGEFLGGHYISISGISNTTARSAWPECQVRAYEYLAAGRGNELTAYEMLMCNTRYPGGSYPITYRADFFRVRELSLSAPVPRRLPGNTVVTVSARNYWTWFNKDWFFSDPEILARGGEASGLNTAGGTIDESVPPPKMFTISVRTTF